MLVDVIWADVGAAGAGISVAIVADRLGRISADARHDDGYGVIGATDAEAIHRV